MCNSGENGKALMSNDSHNMLKLWIKKILVNPEHLTFP